MNIGHVCALRPEWRATIGLRPRRSKVSLGAGILRQCVRKVLRATAGAHIFAFSTYRVRTRTLRDAKAKTALHNRIERPRFDNSCRAELRAMDASGKLRLPLWRCAPRLRRGFNSSTRVGHASLGITLQQRVVDDLSVSSGRVLEECWVSCSSLRARSDGVNRSWAGDEICRLQLYQQACLDINWCRMETHGIVKSSSGCSSGYALLKHVKSLVFST